MTVKPSHCSKHKKVGFLPNRQETEVPISVDLTLEKKKAQASIYAFSELWLYELMCFNLKHKLGTVPYVK